MRDRWRGAAALAAVFVLQAPPVPAASAISTDASVWPVASAQSAAAHVSSAVPALPAAALAGPAPCGPADAGFTAPAGVATLVVSVDLNHEHVLLGPNGERVRTRAKPVWAQDDGDLLPRTWMDKVDWSVYRIDGSDGGDGGHGAGHTRLQFDAAGRLCRVERYDAPRPGHLAALATGGYALEYDASGALLRVAQYEQTRGAAYAMVGLTCLKRDAQGALVEYVADHCADAGHSGGRRYVRNAAGNLLRMIDTADQDGPVAVQTYDSQGRPAQRYVRQYTRFAPPGHNRGPYPYAQPAAAEDRLYVLERDGLARLSTEVPGNEWRIVRLADDVPADDPDMQSWDPGSQTVLAQGMTGPQGESTLAPDAQERVWRAMQDTPGRILWYLDPMSRVMLVPAMPPASWRACSDPGNLAEDACSR